MKKILILLALLVAMTLVLVACKDDPQPPVDDTTVADQPTEEPTQGEEDPTEAPDTDPETPEPGTDEPDEPTTPAPETQAPDTPAPETQAPETPAPETEDPMEPVNVFDAEDIQTVTGGDPSNMTQDCLTLEDGYIHVVPIGPDPYWYPFAGVDGARYVAIRYRTDATGADMQLYMSSTGNGPQDDTTMIRQPVIADGEWHVIIFDTQSLIDAGKYDGEYVSYFRFDPLEAGYKLDENGEPYKEESGQWARYSLPEGCMIDVAYIGFFHSTEAAQKYFDKLHGGADEPETEEPEVPEEPEFYENLVIPQDQWVISGHMTHIVYPDQEGHGPMITAGGVESAALLHQGSIALGNIDLSKYSKVIIYWGSDNGPGTQDLYAKNEHNRFALVNADKHMQMSPNEDTIIVAKTYELHGWAIAPFEIDLTDVDYNGPVFLTHDSLAGGFALVYSIEFVGAEKVDEPEHQHEYTTVVTDPTCTEGGYTTYTCACGDSYVADETPAAGHNFVDGFCGICGEADPDYVAPVTMPAEFVLNMYQANRGETLYFTGAMSGYYLATSTNPADAVKMYSEAVEGGYRMYFYDGDTKTYVDIVYRDATKANVILTTTPTGIFVWNEEAGTWTVTVADNGKTFYLGTYSSHATFSASSISYITGDNAANVGVTQFLAQWADVPAPHEHNYEYETIVVDPTCTEDGYTVHKCECGDGYIDNEIPAVGHNFVDGFCGICGEADPDVETPDEPDAPVAGGAADFNTIVTPNANGDSSYKNTYTTENGWVSENSAIQTGGANNSNPQYTVIGPDNTYKAICMNGKVGVAGKITSPTLSGGISKLVLTYTKMFTDTKLSVTITITDLATGATYTRTVARDVDKDTDKYVVWTDEWVLETPITGDFTIELVNDCPSNNTSSNKDRITILGITWEGAAAEEPETPDEPAANEITVTTTDNYTWVDVVEFTATVSGTYTFYLPAGLGAFDVDDCDAWPPVGGPYVDYYENAEGASFSIDLAEGETTRFYVGALTKADWVITWTVEEKEIGGGDEPGTEDPEIPVEPADDISGTYSTGGDDTLVIDMAAGTLVYTFTGRGGAMNTVEYGISIADGVVTLSNANGPITGPMAPYMGVLELDENGKPSKFYYNGYTYDVTAAGAVEPEPEQPEIGDLILVVGNNNIAITDEIIAEGGIVYQLVVTEEGTYTVNGDFFVQFQDAMGMTYGNGSYLTAGTYDVRLGTMKISAAGNYNAEVEFTAPEGGDVVEPEPSGNPVIESLPFSYEVPAEGLSMDGVYYDYTTAEQITLVITKPAGGLVSPTATNNWDNDADGNYVLVVNAGETISLNFWSMSGITEGVFTVSVQA